MGGYGMIQVVLLLNSLAALCFALSLLAMHFALFDPLVLAQMGVGCLIATPFLRVVALAPRFRMAWVLLALWAVSGLYFWLQ
jgi:uncharacterized membrane protein